MNPPPIPNKFVMTSAEEEFPSQIFCDGVSGIVVSAAHCKLHLYQAAGTDADNAEKRKIVQTLVIPTAALAELCRSVLVNLSEHAPMLRQALTAQQENIVGSAALNTAPAKKDLLPRVTNKSRATTR